MLLDIYTVNATNLGGVEVDLHHLYEDRTVKEARTTQFVHPSGAVVRSKVAPQLTVRARLIAAGSAIRFEVLDDESGQTYWFDGSKWSRNEPRRRLVAIMKPEQMAGQPPLDYREFFLQRLNWTLADILKTWRIIECSTATDQDRTAIDFSAPGDQRLRIEFSKDVELLPVRSVLWYPDGTVCQIVEMSYRRIPEREAWLAERALARFFPQGSAETPESDTWTTQETRSVDQLRLLSAEEAKKLLSAEIPSNFRLEDLTRPVPERSAMRQLPPGENTEADSRLVSLAVFNFAMVALIGSVYVWRRLQIRRSRSRS